MELLFALIDRELDAVTRGRADQGGSSERKRLRARVPGPRRVAGLPVRARPPGAERRATRLGRGIRALRAARVGHLLRLPRDQPRRPPARARDVLLRDPPNAPAAPEPGRVVP